MRVLLDQQDRAVEAGDGREDLLDHLRRQTHARLVEQQQARARHQRAAERQHLLLAARQRARGLPPTLGEAREHREDALEIRRALGAGPRVAAEQQVVDDRQRAERLAALGHLGDARAGRGPPAARA